MYGVPLPILPPVSGWREPYWAPEPADAIDTGIGWRLVIWSRRVRLAFPKAEGLIDRILQLCYAVVQRSGTDDRIHGLIGRLLNTVEEVLSGVDSQYAWHGSSTRVEELRQLERQLWTIAYID